MPHRRIPRASMNETPMPPTAPLACTLAPAELRAQRDALLPGLVAHAFQRVRLPRGMRFVFGATAGRLRQLYAVQQLEKRCCAFLEFRIDVTPGGGALTLDVTGPAGTEAFLESLLEVGRAA
jgi:hypothetical protein